MQTITWICAGLSLAGVWLNIKKDKRCFYLWSVTNATWACVDFYKGLPAQGVLFTVYFILALYGIYKWRSDEKTQN